MINDRFAARFSELQSEWDKMPFEGNNYRDRYVQSGIWKKWATSAESLIKASCGADSPYYVNFIQARERCRGGEIGVFRRICG